MIDERAPFAPPTRGPGAGRGKRLPGAGAHLVEHDDEPSADTVSIDPLDDRESRCGRPRPWDPSLARWSA